MKSVIPLVTMMVLGSAVSMAQIPAAAPVATPAPVAAPAAPAVK